MRLIDADALEKSLEKLWNVHDDQDFANKDVWREIENAPTAETERKKGKWIGDCCSCCGVSKYNYIKMVDDECGPFGTWNFCPHCGARLEGR